MSLNQKMDDTNKPILIGRLIPDSNKVHQHSEVLTPSGISQAILSTYYKNQPKIIVLCDMEVGGGQRGRVYSNQGIIGALSVTDWKNAPKCIVKEIAKEDDNE